MSEIRNIDPVEQMLAETGDEPMSNLSSNPTFESILQHRASRRGVLGGSLSAAVAGIFAPAAALAQSAERAREAAAPQAAPVVQIGPRLGFDAIPVSRSDTAVLPRGYKAQALIPWGTPLTGSYPAYDGVNGNTGEEQEQQVGSHHDGMHYFPFEDDPNGHGLLCVNHEYVDQRVLHVAGPTFVNGQRPTDEVRKEIAAHGMSVVEIKRDGSGTWDVVQGSPYNRRVTANTEAEIRGPVRGSDFVKTKYSPDGTRTRGTLNNCAHGYTPWGTYLTCEENWAGYFVNRGTRPRDQVRYGVPTTNSRYRWETAVSGEDQYVRFDATPQGDDPTQDYRNEPNGQGWVLEIDPFNPAARPVKRTALGRFAHEGVVFAPPRSGEQLAFYQGDDAQNEYIYKFVTAQRWIPNRPDRNMLDKGTLYVARFNEDGTGDWLALDITDPAFQAAAAAAGVEFADQADVLVNTRLAADIVGATKMDRPEWGAVHPRTRDVFFTLTNNSSRTVADAANPRTANATGHIVRMREQGTRAAATGFAWDLFVLAGDQANSQVMPGKNGPALTADNIFASPDGIWVDDNGILWIQTDMSGSQQAAGPFGENQMLAANPFTGEIKRFLVGPKDQETTGVVTTPDGRTMFVNFQHPGDRSNPGAFTSNWPDHGAVYRHPGDAEVLPNPAGPRPRSATLVITREDGGVIGL